MLIFIVKVRRKEVQLRLREILVLRVIFIVKVAVSALRLRKNRCSLDSSQKEKSKWYIHAYERILKRTQLRQK